jgi:nickel-dependent lactate racemase
MQRIELNYGRGRLPVDLSDEIELRVIRKRQMPVLPDPEGAVREALAQPTGVPPLAELARGKGSACILICDITRPVPNGLFLPILIEQLLHAGLAAERIKIVVATGLHRPNEGEELAELVGSRWVMETVEVANHFARDDAAHVDLGTTRTHGVPVKLDRRFVEAELKIATGLVEPHFMAGWSGGRKVIAPGMAHKDTITTFHSARFMEHPRATSCTLEGNPLHETQLEIVEMLGGALAVNTVIDEERRLSFVNFGEIVARHLDAVRHMSEYAEVPLAEQFSTVVTSAAGYPLDKTYYQTVKGMVTPLEIMAPGADLIIASACSEGMGSSEFRDAQRRLVKRGPERFLEEISEKRFADIDEWQTEMQLKPMRIGSIQLYSDGLGEPERELTGVEMIGSVAAAVEASVARSGDRRVAVIPEGPYVVPVYRPAA